VADIYDTGKTAAIADERATLNAFLDYYREAVKAKLRGLSEEQANRRLVPSETTLASLLKHLARVEMSWFQRRLNQTPLEELPYLKGLLEDPDSDFRVEADETIEVLLARYDEQCTRSRQIAATKQLDDVVPHSVLGEVTMRWIMVHMIEETARHAGHADILREQIDGATGD
jgi:uncharacterized damage-inducible protein DinB